MMARFAAVPLILLMIVAFFAAPGAARLLGGDMWEPAGEAVHGGDGVMVQLLRQMYLQQLGAGPSCGTHSANGGCPP
uniref:Uncharacterized protein n=1 Tax=Avena sativa TaxID=4498 RepID=A0ACD5ZRQ8_AVESA